MGSNPHVLRSGDGGDWRSTLQFRLDNSGNFPIQLFLSIMEHEANGKSDEELTSLVIQHLDVEDKQQLTDQLIKACQNTWTEVKSTLVNEFGCESSVQHKTQLLRSLAKGPGENCQHYLIRVRYVTSMIHSANPTTCNCNAAAADTSLDEWTRVLFLAGLQDTERNFCDLNNIPDLDMLAGLLNLNIKTETDDFPVEVKMEKFDPSDGADYGNGAFSYYDDFDDDGVPYEPPETKVKAGRKRKGAAAAGEKPGPKKKAKKTKAAGGGAGGGAVADAVARCKQCGEVFPSKAELKAHKEDKHEEKRSCGLCKEEIPRANFKKHCEERHNGMQVKCEVCGAEFATLLWLKNHIASSQQCDKYDDIKKKVAEGKVFVEENFKHTDPLAPLEPIVTRFKEKGKKSVYKCALCLEIIEGLQEFATHCEEAHDGRRFKCDMCAQASRTLKALHEHRLKVHHVAPAGSKVYHCRIDGCKYKSMSQYQLAGHIDTKHEKTTVYTCQVCSKEFFNKHRLKWHTQSVHMGIRRFKCDQCDIQCDSRQTLKFHMDTHLSGEDRDKEKIMCEECGSSHTNIATLRAHVKRVHNNGKKVKCPHCPEKEYSCNASLVAHLRNVHQLDKKFVCPHCDRGFADSYQLNTHVNVKHLKIKSYHCKICKIYCSNSSNLTYHIAIKHLGFNKEEAKANRHLARQHEAYEMLEQKNGTPKAKRGRPNTSDFMMPAEMPPGQPGPPGAADVKVGLHEEVDSKDPMIPTMA